MVPASATGAPQSLGSGPMPPVSEATVRALSMIFWLLWSLPAFAEGSTCYGTVANGALRGGVALPTVGVNFQSYSRLAISLGRTHVHSRVATVVTEAYAAAATSMPEVTFVYGETGWPEGGRFQPHKTHQNGLSVDFFVPVRDADGKSVPIPTSPFTRYGYDLEFDAKARLDGLTIDFEATAEHLYQLDRAGRRHGAPIALVIFDVAYLERLFATRRGPALRRLPFLRRTPWVRHDEHYHVDFAVPCRPGLPKD